MKIKVQFRDPRIRPLLANAGNWFARELLNPFQVELLHDVKIVVQSDQAMEGKWGICRNEYTILTGPRPRNFKLLLNETIDTYWKVRTLAHEFVHLHQRVRGDLTYRLEGDDLRTYWRTPEGAQIDVTDIPYAKRPQELEANGREEKLTDDFLTVIKAKVAA